MNSVTKITYGMHDGFSLSGETKFAPSEPEPNEISWRLPDCIGTGSIHRVTIRKGFEIWLSDCTFNREIVFKHHELPPFLQFSFILSGHYYVFYEGFEKPEEYRGEHQGIIYFNSSDSKCRVVQDVPIRYLSLNIYPEFFSAYFEQSLQLMPPLIHNLLAHKTNNGYQYKNNITPAMRGVIQQILSCPYHGITRKLFLESRALDLLSLQLDQVMVKRSNCATCIKLHPQDKKQAECARDFLISNMETPPCLEELAKSAGMSHPKLNRCFKQLYGMTVFQYLRNERLNKAKAMLEIEGYSVTETAFQVGYDSLSHFSQAYKKQFGNSPSSCLKVA